MPLAAAQIVDAIAARLSGATITPAGTRVYTSRAWPLQEDQLPAWRVFVSSETVEPITLTSRDGSLRMYQHTATVECEGTVRQVADLDDALNGMAEAAWKRLFATRDASRLDPLGVEMFVSSVDRSMGTEGEAAIGQVSLVLTVNFKTLANAPDIII